MPNTPSSRPIPHFLRFARALTLSSGVALATQSCSSMESNGGPPFPGVQVIPEDGGAGGTGGKLDAGGQGGFPIVVGVLPIPDAAVERAVDALGDASDVADSGMPFPGVRPISPDAQ